LAATWPLPDQVRNLLDGARACCGVAAVWNHQEAAWSNPLARYFSGHAGRAIRSTATCPDSGHWDASRVKSAMLGSISTSRGDSSFPGAATHTMASTPFVGARPENSGLHDGVHRGSLSHGCRLVAEAFPRSSARRRRPHTSRAFGAPLSRMLCWLQESGAPYHRIVSARRRSSSRSEVSHAAIPILISKGTSEWLLEPRLDSILSRIVSKL